MTYAGYIEMDAFCTDLLHDCLYGTDYIAHANRNGKERKNHKYSFRKWAGDHWEYIYDKMTKGSERRQHQENIKNLQSTANRMDGLNTRYFTRGYNINQYSYVNKTGLAKIKEEQAAIDKIDNMPINRLIRAGKATIDMGKKVLDAIIGGVKSAATTVGKAAKDFGGTVKKAGGEAVRNVRRAGSSVKKSARKLGRNIGEGASELGENVGKAAKDFGGTVKKAGGEVVRNASKAGSSVKKSASQLGRNIAEGASELGNNIRRKNMGRKLGRNAVSL